MPKDICLPNYHVGRYSSVSGYLRKRAVKEVQEQEMMANFKLGDLVWARMKGYPPWPGLITNPPEELKNVAKSKNSFCIYFFGSRNYNWIERSNLEAYKPNELKPTKSPKRKGLIEANNEIRDYMNGKKDIVENSATKPKPAKRSYSRKKKSSLSEGEHSKSLKRPGDSSPDESGSANPSKRKAVAPRRKSSAKPTVGRSRKSSSTNTKSDENEAKRSESEGLNGGGADMEESCSSVSSGYSSYRPFNVGSTSSPKIPSNIIVQDYSKDTYKNITPSELKFGFVGLGSMGSRIVKSLLRTGHKVTVWNRSVEKSFAVQELGAEISDTPGDVVEESDVTFCCVSDSQAVHQMVFGNCGVGLKISKGKSFVEMSGICSETSNDIEELITAHNGRYLEVRIQRSFEDSRESFLLLAAGNKDLYNDCESCFASFASCSYFVGESGSAATVNTTLQLVAGVVLAGLAEGLVLAERLGIDLSFILEIMKRSQFNCPLVIESCKAICENNFPPNQCLSYLQNDIENAMRSANTVDQRLYLSTIANEIFKHAKKLGYPLLDPAAVYFSVKS